MTTQTPPADRLAPGARIGDYIIQTVLRIEDTGVVYEATHNILPRRAAIKVMHRDPWLREMAVQIIREACVLEGLDHPGIPRVFECGELPDRSPWIAMERLDGVTIAEAVGASSTLSVPEVIYLLRDAGEILASAHRAGVIHRMVTASNLVRTSGRKFAFGLRNWSDAYNLEVELEGNVPAGLVDERDDVHALGTIAYRALTGELASAQESCAGRRPSAPLELTQLIDQMIAPDRDHRPTAAQVWERATATAQAIELIPALSQIDKPRWTPAYGLSPDRMPKKTQPPPMSSTMTVGGAVAAPAAPAPATASKSGPTPIPPPRSSVTKAPPIVERRPADRAPAAGTEPPAVARTQSELEVRFNKPRSSS